MKLFIPFLVLAAGPFAETSARVYNQAAVAQSQGNPGVAGGVQVWVTDSAPPPAWYGVDLRYVDSTGARQSLWFVCTVVQPFVYGGQWLAVCNVTGLQIQSGTATVMRSDGK